MNFIDRPSAPSWRLQNLALARSPAWRRTLPPALLAVLALLSLGLLLAAAPEGIDVGALQPAETAEGPEDWMLEIEIAPTWVIAFFVGDSVFAVAFGWFFLRLWWALPQRPLAFLGLLAALATAAADLTENALHLEGAIEALYNQAWDLPATEALTSLAALKRGAAAVAGLAFGIAFPAGGRWNEVCRTVLLAMGTVALAGWLEPALHHAHTTVLFFFLLLVIVLGRAAGRPRG